MFSGPYPSLKFYYLQFELVYSKLSLSKSFFLIKAN